jgi:gliding motility-associated-like protein
LPRFGPIHAQCACDGSCGIGRKSNDLTGEDISITAHLSLADSLISDIAWIGLISSDCPDCLTQLVSPMVTTTYSITIHTVDGCMGHDEVTIYVLADDADIYIPNLFSPNGDQINDQFVITAGQLIDEFIFIQIFDRWGNMVFQIKNLPPGDPRTAWDGTFNGEALNPAVFAYRMLYKKRDGTTGLRKGDLTLIR